LWFHHCAELRRSNGNHFGDRGRAPHQCVGGIATDPVEQVGLHRRASNSIAVTGTDFAEPSGHDGQSLTPMYDSLMPLYNSDMPRMLTFVVALD
jgi:hypothetical protein